MQHESISYIITGKRNKKKNETKEGKNETKEETEIRTLPSVEKFKSEIHLQDLYSEKYEIWLNNLDPNMITYFKESYESDIYDNLIKLWE